MYFLITLHSSNTLPFFYSGGLTLPKIPRKMGMEKLLKGRGDPKKGGFCRKGGDAVSLGFFLAGLWQM